MKSLRELVVDSLAANLEQVFIDSGYSISNWYNEANSLCLEWAQTYGIAPNLAAGVLAVLSPAMKWEQNIVAAERIFAQFANVRSGGGWWMEPIPAFNKNKAKAWAMLLSGNVFPYLSGKKVTAFYNNILTPNGHRFVTIDRWMLRIMSGLMDANDPVLAKMSKHYDYFVEALVRVAEQYKVAPLQLQAGVWEHIREIS